MAFEELLQLLSKEESVSAKQEELLRLTMRATAESLLSGEMTAGDPELKAIATCWEAHALSARGKAAGSVEMATRMAAQYAATPGGEAAAEALRRMAAREAALAARAGEFAAFMRGVGALEEDEEEGRAVVNKRSRRPNARYFGPEWRN